MIIVPSTLEDNDNQKSLPTSLHQPKSSTNDNDDTEGFVQKALLIKDNKTTLLKRRRRSRFDQDSTDSVAEIRTTENVPSVPVVMRKFCR